jgi:menaquinone-specific isochorismate synthase
VTPPLPALRVRTTEIDDPGDLLAHQPDPRGGAWVRRGEGLITWGEALRLDLGTGAADGGVDNAPLRTAAAAVRQLAERADVEDGVDLPGSGLVALVSATFDPAVAGSLLVVPRVLVGRRDGCAWVTTVGTDADPPPAPPLGPVRAAPAPGRIRYAGAQVDELRWLDAVARATRAISAGELDKVVLARDLAVWSTEALDARTISRRLADRFPDCFTFAVDGLLGATPELLVRRTGRRVESLVLAGTARRAGDAAEDAAIGRALLDSGKDRDEHLHAVASVREALTDHVGQLQVDGPSLLRLDNVQHLATAVAGDLEDSATSVLDLTAALHPTAAVCGTPTDEALALDPHPRGLDRGRYAGPGRLGRRGGDGELGSRCAARSSTGTGRGCTPAPASSRLAARGRARGDPAEAPGDAVGVRGLRAPAAQASAAAAASSSRRCSARFAARSVRTSTSWSRRPRGRPRPPAGARRPRSTGGARTAAPRDRGEVDAVGGAEEPLEARPCARRLRQEREDPAAVVVDDDEDEVGRAARRRDEEPVLVVEQRQVAGQGRRRARRGPAPRRWRWTRTRRCRSPRGWRAPAAVARGAWHRSRSRTGMLEATTSTAPSGRPAARSRAVRGSLGTTSASRTRRAAVTAASASRHAASQAPASRAGRRAGAPQRRPRVGGDDLAATRGGSSHAASGRRAPAGGPSSHASSERDRPTRPATTARRRAGAPRRSLVRSSRS